MKNQAQRLLNHFNEGKTIDRLRALNELGIFELSARLIDLQNAGYKFNKERKRVTNRFGEKCTVVEYSLVNPFTELP